MPGKIRAALALVLASLCPAQDTQPPFAFAKQQLHPLERVIFNLARAARPEQVATLLQVLAELGYPEKSLASLTRRQAKIKPTSGNPQRRIAGIATSLEVITQELAAGLANIADRNQRERLARVLLRIDHESVPAHLALDQVQLAGRWVVPMTKQLAPRKAEIQTALQTVRALQPEVEISRSEHELLLQVHGRAGHLVAGHGMQIHTLWPAAQAKRLLQNLLRAMAFSKYLIHGGPITLPKDLHHRSVLFGAQPGYLQAIEHDVELGMFDADRLEEARLWVNYGRKDGVMVWYAVLEDFALASIFGIVSEIAADRLHGHAPQPCLISGHGNWVLMALTGAHLPGIAVDANPSNRPTSSGGSGTSASARFLAGAGLLGARQWLHDKVLRGEDPPWSRSFLDQVGNIQGENMLKTTFVVEYLQLQGPLQQLLTRSQKPTDGSEETTLETMQRALGMPLHEFELGWRQWLRGTGNTDTSVLADLRSSPDPDRGADQAAMRYLARIRESAHSLGYLPGNLPRVALDPGLSRQANLHASYLELHPEQLTRWPNVHEEYPDRDGFTAEGAWAGNHSLIAPEIEQPKQALDLWMGTFFQRLQLLNPGLIRIGWGLAGSTAVLDANSMVRDMNDAWEVAWPYDQMQNVPLRFSPELPSPYPGEDQSLWGYPITLQIGPRFDRLDPKITMTLRLGSEDRPLVPCLFSTPNTAGNPRLAPERSWCLIPKQHLLPQTEYHVKAVFDDEADADMTWSFRTR